MWQAGLLIPAGDRLLDASVNPCRKACPATGA